MQAGEQAEILLRDAIRVPGLVQAPLAKRGPGMGSAPNYNRIELEVSEDAFAGRGISFEKFRVPRTIRG